MSWGSTGFTPIVTNNQPPFGFAEVITPPDFKTNPTDPWSSTDELKADLNKRFTDLEKKRDTTTTTKETFEPSTIQRRRRIPVLSNNLLFLIAIAAGLWWYAAATKK